MSTRRAALEIFKAGHASHAGLWLDRFLPAQRSESNTLSIATHFDEVAVMPLPAEYEGFFAKWRSALTDYGCQLAEATVVGRMVVGLGAESVLENQIALQRTYGVPMIPGSALKGLTASYARRRLQEEQWGAKSEAYRLLFGNADKLKAADGIITFFDALYIPGSAANGHPLEADIMTVHHPQYYQSGLNAPADWDSPTPIPFLSATGRYLLALAGPAEWVSAAYKILGHALAEEGIGAKTSSGYGRMQLGGALAGQTDNDDGRATGEDESGDGASTPQLSVTAERLLNSFISAQGSVLKRELSGLISRWNQLREQDDVKQFLAAKFVDHIDNQGCLPDARKYGSFNAMTASAKKWSERRP